MSDASVSHVVHADTPDPRRWYALFVIAIAQLMVVLDASIVNIALPHASLPRALGGLAIAPKNYQWAVTAYTLTFGGFLLLGGRIGDYMGRKKAFLIGLLGFAGASLLGGFAMNQQMLFGARALQGVFGALLAPAALSLISVTFTDSKERAKAFGVYGALSGVGAAIGLIAGGLLTQYFSWRWCLFVNTPLALIAFALAIPDIHESKVEGHPHYDVPGALSATAGMVSVVYGVSQASTNGWAANSAWPFIVIGAVLLAIFFVIESRKKQPLLPLRLLTDRIRAGAYATQILVALGMFGMFLFMTFYFQSVHHYSAVKSGLLFLPFSVGVIIAAGTTSHFLPKVGPRPLASIGCTMGAVGLLFLSLLKPSSSYLAHIMPSMIITSLGLGMAFVAIASTALFNVRPQDTGAASAVLTTAQQIGGSFGTALQNTIAVSSAAAFAATATHASMSRAAIAEMHVAASVHGYDMAFRFGSLALFLAGVTFFSLVNIDRHHLGQHDEVVAAAH
ncbi:MAG TPA: MFS transporter [Acidimicrobiales bacterium]|nr:MFS transporter [Acidimicrobiales bacterium]